MENLLKLVQIINRGGWPIGDDELRGALVAAGLRITSDRRTGEKERRKVPSDRHMMRAAQKGRRHDDTEPYA